MSKLKLFSLQRNIFMKFALSFVLVGLIPLLALSYLLLDTFTRQMEQYAYGNLEQMMLYMNRNSSQYFKAYNDVSKLMYTNGAIYKTLVETLSKNKEDWTLSDQQTLWDFVRTILVADRYIQNVMFVRSDKTVYTDSKQNSVFDVQQFPLSSWSKMIKTRERELTFISTHPDSYFAFSNKRVMTFARNLIDTSTTLDANPTVLGTLYFDVDVALFDDMFASVKLGKQDRITLSEAEGTIIYSNVKSMIGTQLPGAGRPTAGKNEYLLVQDNPDTGQSLIGRFSKSDLYSGLVKVKRYLAIVVLVCTLSLILMSIVFSRRFSRPIRDVIKMMTKMESGKLDVAIPVSSEDELGQLAHGFNRMTTRLNRFINEAYIAEIKRKQAELNALKGQIRPHYLYNTLEVVRMSAVANDDMPVADMIHALSNQLKYVLDYGQDIVSVREELEHVGDYLHLIRSRFGDRIELETFVAPDVSSEWGMMKLSIQPLIENAVQHGLKPRGNRGKIRISLERTGDAELKVTVVDDGVGMVEEKLDELRRLLNGELQDGEGRIHVGLRNVHERLQSLFGPAYGIQLNSVPHVGTSVQFAMPVIQEGTRYAQTDSGR